MTLCNCYEQDPPESSTDPVLPAGVPRLRSFYLYLSSCCNLRCRHCWITPNYSENLSKAGTYIDPIALKEAVVEAKSLGLRSAKLTGGEPLLHPQFRDIVSFLTTEGLSLDLETNGTRITRELAQYLRKETNVGFISVSIDSPVPADHDTFRGVNGSFEATIRGLDLLVDAGYSNCQVIMSVHQGNRNQIEDLINLAIAHKAGSIKFNPVTRSGRGRNMHENGEAPGYDEFRDLARYIKDELSPRYNIPLSLPMPSALTSFNELWLTRGCTGDCGVSGILGILGSGEIALCGIGQTIPELVYGMLGKDSIRDIWLNHPVILKLRKDLADYHHYPGICGSCIHAKVCRTGCVVTNFQNSGKLVSPNWLCEEAERREEFPANRIRTIK